MRRINLNLFAVVFGFALSLPGLGGKVWAQTEQPKISIHIDIAKEVKQFKDNKWSVQLVPALSSKRDDILVYTITYNNEGRSPAIDSVIVDPIPNGTVYLPDSATCKNAEIYCSVDGGLNFQTPPAKYFVQKPDGSREEKVAPANMYTHIKWTIRKPLLPGESGKLSFKSIVQ
jgi:uncharacterized repeat protein (TIGR01451 family)